MTGQPETVGVAGVMFGSPVGFVGSTPYIDPPAILHDQFPARVTVVVAVPTGGFADGTTAVRLGFQEQQQDPATGAFTDRPGGRESDGTQIWAVGIANRTYAVGDRLLLQRHRARADVFEVVTTGGTAVLDKVRADSDNDGSSGVWTQATRYDQDAAGLPVPSSPPVLFAVYPLPGHLIVSGDPLEVVRFTGLMQPASPPPSPPPPPPPPGVPPPPVSPTPAAAGLPKVWVHGVRSRTAPVTVPVPDLTGAYATGPDLATLSISGSIACVGDKTTFTITGVSAGTTKYAVGGVGSKTATGSVTVKAPNLHGS